MSSHHSDQMSQRSQVSRVTVLYCIVFIFYFCALLHNVLLKKTLWWRLLTQGRHSSPKKGSLVPPFHRDEYAFWVMIVNAQKTNFGNIGILMLYEVHWLYVWCVDYIRMITYVLIGFFDWLALRIKFDKLTSHKTLYDLSDGHISILFFMMIVF